MKSAFVTGGSGFVGRNLIRQLRTGKIAVRALARNAAAVGVVERIGAAPVAGDLGDTDAMQRGMEGCDAVFHSAAQVTEWGPRELFHRVNVDGTRNALAAAKAARVPRFVHVSTEAVLANGDPLVNVDESRPRPRDALPRYPATKGQAEALVLRANSPELQTVVVRPRMIWGNDDSSLLPAFRAAIQAGRFMWIDGGRFMTSTTHVDNVCEGLILAAENGRGGEIYFVTDGAPVRFRDFLQDLLATQGVDPGSRNIPKKVALPLAFVCEKLWDALGIASPPPITRMVIRLLGEEVTVNDAKARRELGYQGRVTRDAGLAAMRRAMQS